MPLRCAVTCLAAALAGAPIGTATAGNGAVASPVSAGACAMDAGVQYTKPDHYNELNTSVPEQCCDACTADSQCAAWKVCTRKDRSITCRLLATPPTASEPDSACVSGRSGRHDPPAPGPAPPPSPRPRRHECTPQDHGAKGDGHTIDTVAFNAALAGCERVLAANGTFVVGTLHLVSDLELVVDGTATIQAAPAGGHHFDAADPNPWDAYQDYGHSHWRDSLLYGRGLRNVTVRGRGTIDGAGQLATGTPAAGDACRLFGVVSTERFAVDGVSLRGGGWFTFLVTNVTGLSITNLDLAAARDGMDIVSCRHVLVDNVTVHGGGDDAIALKSDFSLGQALESYDIRVTNSRADSGCNALQFGSETVGEFRDVAFQNIVVGGAGKAGIGIVTMDGSHIHDVTYTNITMSGTTTPIYMYIGARMRRPPTAASSIIINSSDGGGAPLAMRAPGSISNVTFTRVSARRVEGPRGNWTATLDGQPADPGANVTGVYPVGPGIRFAMLDLDYVGGGAAAAAGLDPPHPADQYPPRYLGERPSYGFFIRRAHGVSFDGVRLSHNRSRDGRPAVLLQDAQDIAFDGLSVQRDSTGAVAYDVGVRAGCSGVAVNASPGVVVQNVTGE